MFLTCDGTVYAGGGNIDNAGRKGAFTVNTGTAGPVRDLTVWGFHGTTIYYGGGYVISGAQAC